MRKYIIILFLLIFNSFFTQINNSYYPAGVDTYKGGTEKMYKDIHDVLIEQNAQKCSKDEFIYVKLKIDCYGKASFIKDKGVKALIEKYPCAYKYAISTLGQLHDWIPANKNKIFSEGAIYEFPFFPNDLIGESYQPNYNAFNETGRPAYEGGIDAFRKELMFLMSSYLEDLYKPEGIFELSFTVDENGKASNFDIFPKTAGSGQFVADINTVTKRIKNKWTPAKLRGQNIPFRNTIKINFRND